MKTFVIAEAGANHNRDFEIAKELINVASESGADACKFQTYSSETLYAKNTPDFAGYSNINQLIKDIELPREWQKDLKSYCDSKDIEFMSTPFDEKAVQELVDLGVKRLKIAGFEATDPRFVDMVASTKLPIIMSIGIGFEMNYMGMFLDIFQKHGNHVTLLHCNNAYPTPMEDVNLKRIETLKAFNGVDLVGLSDHTMTPLTPALAVAAGAEVIEKHFTLSRKMEGPDHPFAMEPEQLNQMVEYIREAEKTMGSKSNGYTQSEKSFSKARRSVVAKYDLKKGDILTEDNITTKRPLLENSIPALDYNGVIGYPIADDIKADTPLSKELIPQYYEPRIR